MGPRLSLYFPLALVDAHFAKGQLDTNRARMVSASQRPASPPTNGTSAMLIHPWVGWAAWRVFQIERKTKPVKGGPAHFLETIFS